MNGVKTIKMAFNKVTESLRKSEELEIENSEK
jgi:hypothetical protein